MRQVLPLCVFLAGCGVLSSGAGAPANPPASGLGPTTPWSDETGLSWSPPFILADPAYAFSHPAALVDGDAIELWIEVAQGESRRIGHARAESFEAGFVTPTDEAIPSLPWHAGGVGSPAVIRDDDGRVYVFYLSDGKLGLYARDGESVTARPSPLEVTGPVRAVAAARVDRFVLVSLLADDRIDQLVFDRSRLSALLDGAALEAPRASTGISVPSWATGFLDMGQRLERTAAGRWRQDLFFAASLPSMVDLGTQPAPSAIGAASRYVADGVDFELVPTPILSGSPYPRSATAVGYRGGVLLLYAARSGPRDAIGVARQP